MRDIPKQAIKQKPTQTHATAFVTEHFDLLRSWFGSPAEAMLWAGLGIRTERFHLEGNELEVIVRWSESDSDTD